MSVCTREELLDCLPPYQDKWLLISDKQSVKDIIKEVLRSHQEFAPYYDNIALYFYDDSIEKICENLFFFLKDSIKYREEKEDDQTTALPTGILRRGYGDCKHYSTFSGGILDSITRLTGKKINWCYRFASYDVLNKSPHHVFVVVKDRGDEIWIDPTPGSDNTIPVWYIDKKSPVMALRRNIAGIGDSYLQPISFASDLDPSGEGVVYVAPDQLPVAPNEMPSLQYVENLEEQQVEEELTPELQGAIEVLLSYGIMNEAGEISDKVLTSLAPTLSIAEFENISKARDIVLSEVEKSATMGSFFSKLWSGVKKVTLAIPRNAYLSLVALNAFGFATKLKNALYNSDGTYWQPGQQQLYDKWKKLGGTWTNLRNAIDSGSKKKAILGGIIQIEDVSDDCIDYRIDGNAIGVAPAAAAATWYTIASTIIAAMTPLILGILKERARVQQLPPGIDPNTGFPYGTNPGAVTPTDNIWAKIKVWVQDNPIVVALGAAGIAYVVIEKPFKKRRG